MVRTTPHWDGDAKVPPHLGQLTSSFVFIGPFVEVQPLSHAGGASNIATVPDVTDYPGIL